MAELTEAVAEVAENVGEEAFDLADTAREVAPRDLRLLFIGLGVGLIAGTTIGTITANRRLRAKYQQLAEEEIDEMREHFRQRLVAKEEKPDLTAEAAKISRREGYDGPSTPLLEEDEDEGVPAEEQEIYPDESPQAREEVINSLEVEENVFDKDEPQEGGWDYEAEVARRRPEYPYVIHVDERYDKDGYTHTELTYFEGDQVLVDTDDKPVEDIDKVVGQTNLDKFGHGSGDKDVVFIRNDELKLEVEVSRDARSYTEVVHGIQHSDEPRRRRARFDDEEPT